MKHLKRIFEFVTSTDDTDELEMRDILSDVSDMGAKIEIYSKWTLSNKLTPAPGGPSDSSDTWDRARNKESSNANKIYKVEVSFETIGKSLLEVSDMMKEMNDVSHKVKMISDEFSIEWMTNYYGADDVEDESNKLVFRIYFISKREVGKLDPIGDVTTIVDNLVNDNYSELSTYLHNTRLIANINSTQMKDAIRVDIVANSLMGNPKGASIRDALDEKRFKIISKLHDIIKSEVESRTKYTIQDMSNDWDWGIRKHTNGRYYPYFFIKLQ